MTSTATNSSNRVGEIFTFAGNAFSKLGELTMHLQAYQDANGTGQKWDEDDIEMLRTAVRKFGEDLNKISDNIKQKTNANLKFNLRKKAYDEAGISPNQLPQSFVNNVTAATTASSHTNAAVPQSTESKFMPKQMIFEETPVVESEMEVHS